MRAIVLVLMILTLAVAAQHVQTCTSTAPKCYLHGFSLPCKAEVGCVWSNDIPTTCPNGGCPNINCRVLPQKYVQAGLVCSQCELTVHGDILCDPSTSFKGYGHCRPDDCLKNHCSEAECLVEPWCKWDGAACFNANKPCQGIACPDTDECSSSRGCDPLTGKCTYVVFRDTVWCRRTPGECFGGKCLEYQFQLEGPGQGIWSRGKPMSKGMLLYQHDGEDRNLVKVPPSYDDPSTILFWPDGFPLDAGMVYKLTCPSVSPRPCEVFATMVHCLHCSKLNGNFPALLPSHGWVAGSCAPAFGPYPMVAFRRTLQPGESIATPPTERPILDVLFYMREDPCDGLASANCIAPKCLWNAAKGVCVHNWCPRPKSTNPAPTPPQSCTCPKGHS
eukprot:Sspe_Gene.1717::Locus_571_Transcript_9_10_Confidence_0.100_Length_1581::g.1717::m.1717